MDDKKTKVNVVKPATRQKTFSNTHINENTVLHNRMGFVVAESKTPSYKKESIPSGKINRDKILVSPPMGRKK